MNSKKIAGKPAKSNSGKISLQPPVKATTKASPRLAVNHNETLLVG